MLSFPVPSKRRKIQRGVIQYIPAHNIILYVVDIALLAHRDMIQKVVIKAGQVEFYGNRLFIGVLYYRRDGLAFIFGNYDIRRYAVAIIILDAIDQMVLAVLQQGTMLLVKGNLFFHTGQFFLRGLCQIIFVAKDPRRSDIES